MAGSDVYQSGRLIGRKKADNTVRLLTFLMEGPLSDILIPRRLAGAL